MAQTVALGRQAIIDPEAGDANGLFTMLASETSVSAWQELWGHTPILHFSTLCGLAQNQAIEAVLTPVQLPIIHRSPNRHSSVWSQCATSSTSHNQTNGGVSGCTSTSRAFYVQVGVPMRLPDAGRLVGSNLRPGCLRSGSSANALQERVCTRLKRCFRIDELPLSLPTGSVAALC